VKAVNPFSIVTHSIHLSVWKLNNEKKRSRSPVKTVYATSNTNFQTVSYFTFRYGNSKGHHCFYLPEACSGFRTNELYVKT